MADDDAIQRKRERLAAETYEYDTMMRLLGELLESA